MTDAATRSNQSAKSAFTQQYDFKQKIDDAIAKIQINPDFSLWHPDYPPVLFSERYRNYLLQMSEAERNRCLQSRLQQYLYDILMEKLKPSAASELDESDPAVNQGDRWYETQFFQQLTQNNHGKGYSDPDWTISGQVGEYWQVTKNGLTLYIHPQQHLNSNSALQVGQTVSIAMPANSIEHGLYVAIGNAGSVCDRPCSLEHKILQLHLNVNSNTALELLDCLTRELNDRHLPFNFKLAYREADFQYLDAAVLEFMARDWVKVKPIIRDAYLGNNFAPLSSFFCLPIAPGLGLAEKPFALSNDKTENLGYLCCDKIANFLVKIHIEDDKPKANLTNYQNGYILDKIMDGKPIYLNNDSKTNYSTSLWNLYT